MLRAGDETAGFATGAKAVEEAARPRRERAASFMALARSVSASSLTVGELLNLGDGNAESKQIFLPTHKLRDEQATEAEPTYVYVPTGTGTVYTSVRTYR